MSDARNSFSNGGLAAGAGPGGNTGNGQVHPSSPTICGTYIGGPNQLRDDPTKVFATA